MCCTAFFKGKNFIVLFFLSFVWLISGKKISWGRSFIRSNFLGGRFLGGNFYRGRFHRGQFSGGQFSWYHLHKITFTVLKAYLQKEKPKRIKYRNCKKFDKNLFRYDFLNELLSKKAQTKHLDLFKDTAQYVFDRHALLKEKHIRCNQASFVNKNVMKAIMNDKVKNIE